VLFHTWTFVLFFAIAWPVYLAVKNTRMREPWLLAASYTFYGWWNPLHLLLIAYATVVDYTTVTVMTRARRPAARKACLAVSVVNNLALLSVFKYAGLLTRSLDAVLAHLGVPYSLPAPDILLPVGISFFTFQSMSYAIDAYRGHVDREVSLVRYATFVSLFPQLVAGPIERASNLLPQLRKALTVTLEDVTDGASLFVVGLFKKIALADYLAMYVDRVYDAPAAHHAPALILATVAFGWQIYFDFSGYTDMARGAARMLGIRLMLNFNHPYLADGLGDFWRRWHISLSSWFRDYVYIPLGGNRKGEGRTYANMAGVMIVSGLWHGAAWTFVMWGLMHAVGRVFTRRLEGTAFYANKVPRPVKQMLVFAFVTFAWIFFRARTMGDATAVIRGIFSGGWGDPEFPLPAALLVGAVWAYQFLCESRLRWTVRLAPVRVAIVSFMILYMATVTGGGNQPFYYFQF
jgi:D-alanyl-lipoteichoic acid acyltransferase DltB (MBOAT superfamily)